MPTPSPNQTQPKAENPVINQVPQQRSKPILRPIEENMQTKIDEPNNEAPKKSKKPLLFLLAIVVVILGSGTGYLLANNNSSGTSSLGNGDKDLKREVSSQDEIVKGLKVGIADESTFSDDATGEIEIGGVMGEGSHKLIRPGGDSQTVALTSSVIDLDQFAGRKVKIWGETMSAQKAGWFMDVGKLEVLE